MKQILKKTYYVPKPVEKVEKGMVKWGRDNLFGQWIAWLYYTCSVHAGIINGKVFFTTSGGLDHDGGDDLQRIVELFEPIMPEMSRSLEMTNSYYLKCRLSMDKQRVESVKYIPFEYVRATTDKNTFRISKHWNERTPEYVELRTYEVVKRSEDRTELWFIIPFKRQGMQFQLDGVGRKVSENYYPVVPYSGAINSILSDIEITNYSLSEIVNHFSLGSVLSLNNGMVKNDDDKTKLLNRISDETTGTDNAGGVLVLFNNGKETAPTVEHLNGNQLNERYLALSKDVRDNIMKGHSVVSGELFGFMNEGNFNTTKIDWAYYIMKNNYFRQRQHELLESVEMVQEINRVAGSVSFNDVELPTNRMEPATTTPTAAPVETFSKKEKEEKEEDRTEEVLAAFAEIGTPKDDRKILMSEPLKLEHPFGGVFDGLVEPEKFVSAVELQILNMMVDGETHEEIAKALGIKPADFAKILHRLKRGGHVNNTGQLTEAGRVESIRSQVAKLEIVYSYEVKPGVGAEVIPGTRDFCRTLIGENKFYTRQEIDEMSVRLFDDKNTIFMYRGGWWNDNGTNRPACRHFWQQHVTYKNN